MNTTREQEIARTWRQVHQAIRYSDEWYALLEYHAVLVRGWRINNTLRVVR